MLQDYSLAVHLTSIIIYWAWLDVYPVEINDTSTLIVVLGPVHEPANVPAPVLHIPNLGHHAINLLVSLLEPSQELLVYIVLDLRVVSQHVGKVRDLGFRVGHRLFYCLLMSGVVDYLNHPGKLHLSNLGVDRFKNLRFCLH